MSIQPVIDAFWLLVTRDGREYLFTDEGDPDYGNRFSRFWCRLTGHRAIIYYNPNGWEPDTRCSKCGTDLE